MAADAAHERRQDQCEGEREFHHARGAHVEFAVKAHAHRRMTDEQREGPLRVGPFLDRGPHQRDGGALANDIERPHAVKDRVSGRSAQDRRRCRERSDNPADGRCRIHRRHSRKARQGPSAVKIECLAPEQSCRKGELNPGDDNATLVLSSGVRMTPPFAQRRQGKSRKRRG